MKLTRRFDINEFKERLQQYVEYYAENTFDEVLEFLTDEDIVYIIERTNMVLEETIDDYEKYLDKRVRDYVDVFRKKLDELYDELVFLEFRHFDTKENKDKFDVIKIEIDRYLSKIMAEVITLVEGVYFED